MSQSQGEAVGISLKKPRRSNLFFYVIFILPYYVSRHANNAASLGLPSFSPRADRPGSRTADGSLSLPRRRRVSDFLSAHRRRRTIEMASRCLRRSRASFSHTQHEPTIMSALLASSFVSRVAAFKATKIQVRRYAMRVAFACACASRARASSSSHARARCG